MNNLPSQLLPYWRNETSGKLAAAILAYADHVAGTNPVAPTPHQIALIKTYVQIWADYPYQGDRDQFNELRSSVEKIQSVEDLNRWCDRALRLGIDPF